MAEHIRYESVRGEGEVVTGFTFLVVGANGEIQGRGERYASQSNAKRGVADLYRTLADAVATGELDPEYGEGVPAEQAP